MVKQYRTVRRADNEYRRAQIIRAAHELFVEKGIEKTSILDITERVGVTRSLFYHYFSGKDDVVDAILDSYVDTFVGKVHEWDEHREQNNVRKALDDCVAMLRENLFDIDEFRRELHTPDHAYIHQRFVSKTAESLGHYLATNTAVDYARYHNTEVKHIAETLGVLVYGLISYMRRNPDTPDSVVADIIADVLHLEL